MFHKPVMLTQCLDALNIRQDGIYVDLTFGGGGHSTAILERLGPEGRLYSFDQDADAEANGREIVARDKRLTFVHANFRFLINHMHYLGVRYVDGVLADLGVSSHQFDDACRGFSFRGDAPLDMRMNRKQELNADVVLGTYDEERLADVFYLYGELRNARRIAAAVVAARSDGKPWTAEQLCNVVAPFVGPDREKKDLARIFQAIRIEVNGEMDALRQMLDQIPDILAPEGRFVVMTYHSLEDRMVKNFLRTGNVEGRQKKDFYGRTIAPLTQINSKVIVPTDDEIADNPRSRSAKLRIGGKAL
ncbi:MAG: 16S rRNA (cytosine(1402)-N(4))-methyltransferase RsmH [Paludibacteraceae bacterium]|nr:16S rRNA (cytosine(1402)-N(4))-methyltransferase RsmH [Paludibacteraceae bacterium]